MLIKDSVNSNFYYFSQGKLRWSVQQTVTIHEWQDCLIDTQEFKIRQFPILVIFYTARNNMKK